MNLFFCRGAEHFNDFDELIDTRLTREEWLSDEQLRDDATDRPHIDGSSIVGRSKDELWRSVVEPTSFPARPLSIFGILWSILLKTWML